jgi:hypothetical protein
MASQQAYSQSATSKMCVAATLYIDRLRFSSQAKCDNRMQLCAQAAAMLHKSYAESAGPVGTTLLNLHMTASLSMHQAVESPNPNLTCDERVKRTLWCIAGILLAPVGLWRPTSTLFVMFVPHNIGLREALTFFVFCLPVVITSGLECFRSRGSLNFPLSLSRPPAHQHNPSDTKQNFPG